MEDSDGTLIQSWRQAEEFSATHMRGLGFEDAEVTPPGADGGIDVVATGAVAQVKHFSETSVSAPTVQQLLGAAKGAQMAVFYSLTGYTSSAIRLAEERGVALFAYSVAGDVAPLSTAADNLALVGRYSWQQVSGSLVLQQLGRAVEPRVVEVGELLALVGEQAMPLIHERIRANPDEADALRLHTQLDRGLRELSRLFKGFDGHHTRDLQLVVLELGIALGILKWMCDEASLDFAELEQLAIRTAAG